MIPPARHTSAIEPRWRDRVAHVANYLGFPCVVRWAMAGCSLVVRDPRGSVVFRKRCVDVLAELRAVRERARHEAARKLWLQ